MQSPTTHMTDRVQMRSPSALLLFIGCFFSPQAALGRVVPVYIYRAPPTSSPTSSPSYQPSSRPSSQQPSSHPSSQPSSQPTSNPSSSPSSQPSLRPSSQPSSRPSFSPSSQPSLRPSSQPSSKPSFSPSFQPTSQPTSHPSFSPSYQPSSRPSSHPTSNPSSSPTSQPSLSAQPSSQPSSNPSSPSFLRTSNSLVNPSRKSTSPLIISVIILQFLFFVGVGLYLARYWTIQLIIGGSQDSLDEMQDEEEFDTQNAGSATAMVRKPSRHPNRTCENREDDSKRRKKDEQNREGYRQRESYGDYNDNDNVDDLDELGSDGVPSRRSRFNLLSAKKKFCTVTKVVAYSASDDMKDDDDSGIHSSSCSESYSSYQQGDGGASVGGSVSIVSEFGGKSATCGESVSVSSETSSGADSGFAGIMSQDASILWSRMHSYMTGSVASSVAGRYEM